MSRILDKSIVHFLLIFVLGLLVYSNTFDVPFHFDDHEYMISNPALRDFSYFLNPSQIEDTNLSAPIKRYSKTRAVAYMSFWANYKIGGLDVTSYHVINMAVHIVNALFVYMLVRLTFMTPFFSSSESKRNSGIIALFSGLLFVAHPIQTMAVTYILQRWASLAAMFYLLSIVLYVKWRLGTVRNSEIRVRSKSAAAGSFLYYIAALLSCGPL
jgi:hypothetical protein